MLETARRDMRGEGFDPSSALFELELETMGAGADGDVAFLRIPLPGPEGLPGTEMIMRAYREKSGRGGNADGANGGLRVEAARLIVSSPVEHVELKRHRLEGEDASHALIGEREVCWDGGTRLTPVYDMGLLRCGNVVHGPAVIEQDDTTCVIPAGRRLKVDGLLNGVIERG